MTETTSPRDLTRTTVGVLFIVLLAGASLWVMRPFLLPLVWATTIVISTWPILLRAQARLWNKRWLAAAVMVGLLILVFLIPATIAVAVVVANADTVLDAVARLRTLELPMPPAWIANLPLVGASIAERWRELAVEGPGSLGALVAPHANELIRWILLRLQGLGLLFLDFALTAILAAILYARGEIAGESVRRFAGRLAGPRGEEAAVLAGQSIRSVALGVVVTALLQACIGGLGLLLTGVPVAALLTAAMFLLAIAQIGAGPVLTIATVWLFVDGSTGAGIVLAVWTVVVSSLDNVVRPLLIRRGVRLPLLLIFAGVIGGLIAFGVIGIFVGPVLLAVTYTLLVAWVRGTDAVVAAPAPVLPTA